MVPVSLICGWSCAQMISFNCRLFSSLAPQLMTSWPKSHLSFLNLLPWRWNLWLQDINALKVGDIRSFIIHIHPPQLNSSEIKSFLEPASCHIPLLLSHKWPCTCLLLPFKMEWKADQIIRKYFSSDSPSKRLASAYRSVRPDIAAEYIFRSPACVQRHTFGRRRGCRRKNKKTSCQYILKALDCKVEWWLSRGLALSCYSININKAHQSAWKEGNSFLMSQNELRCDNLWRELWDDKEAVRWHPVAGFIFKTWNAIN